MTISNACFVSYRHAGPATEIVRRFCHELSVQLALLTPTLGVDVDERSLRPGDYIDDGLALEMCRSTCMVLLFTPEYFDVNHPYCAREYRGMVALEERRRDALPPTASRSLIIPVIIRGESRVPNELRPRVFMSFDRSLLQASDVRKPRVIRGIRDIADAIYERVDAMRDANPQLMGDCSQFRLPSTNEIAAWLQTVAPRPLASPTQAVL